MLQVRKYHKEFYRPENLKIIITGQVKPEDVFKALAPLEAKIISKGERGPFTRPWQNTIPSIPKSDDLILKYPDDDDENNGIFRFSFRGPSAVNDIFTLTALGVLLKYLTDLSVSPLQKEFIEIDDPFASQVFTHVSTPHEYVISKQTLAGCLLLRREPRIRHSSEFPKRSNQKTTSNETKSNRSPK